MYLGCNFRFEFADAWIRQGKRFEYNVLICSGRTQRREWGFLLWFPHAMYVSYITNSHKNLSLLVAISFESDSNLAT